MNGGLDVIVMHRDNSPFIQPQMWRPLSPAQPEMREKRRLQFTPQSGSLFLLRGKGYWGYFRECSQQHARREGLSRPQNGEDAAGDAQRRIAGEDTGNCESKTLNKGLRVHASVDLSMQAALEDASLVG